MEASSAWALFQSGQEPPGVRDEVLTSWRRSRSSGVDPEYAAVPYVETDVDSPFSRVAVPVMTAMADLLVGDRSCLALSDAAGSVIWRWVSEPMLRNTLDDLLVVEGFNFGEESVGTNGLGTSLETGGIAIVRGAEHFVQRFHDVTCVAAPVRHPITRRTIGAVNVTCRATDTNSLLAVIVGKLVDEIQQALHEAATVRERQLLSAFLRAQRATAGPVAVVGDGLIIANPQAAALGLDQLGLWDEIRAGRHGPDRTHLALPAELTADVRLVRAGGRPAGAVVTVRDPAGRPSPAARRRRAPGPAQPRVAGLAPVQRVAALAADGPVAVLGEPGTGKATVLRGALGDGAVLDAATYALDPVRWLDRLRRRLASGAATIVRHAEAWELGDVRRVVAVVGEVPGRGTLGFTVTVSDADPVPAVTTRLLDALAAGTLALPPLRRSPDAVSAAARAELHRHDRRLSFTADALAAMRRYSWPGNRAELSRIVRDLARDADGPSISAADLPAEVRQAGERRALTPLEAAEASVIASVLRGAPREQVDGGAGAGDLADGAVREAPHVPDLGVVPADHRHSDRETIPVEMSKATADARARGSGRASAPRSATRAGRPAPDRARRRSAG